MIFTPLIHLRRFIVNRSIIPTKKRVNNKGKDQFDAHNAEDKPGNALRFLGQLGNPFEAVGVDQKGRAAIDWGVYGIPETFVIGRDATIRYKHVGPLDPVSLKKFQAEIDKAVKG